MKNINILQEGQLRNGDHLLQVGDVRLWGMGAQQVTSSALLSALTGAQEVCL